VNLRWPTSPIVRALLALAVLTSAALAEAVELPEPTEEPGARLKPGLLAETRYTSNLFHVQDRRVAAFEAHRDPGQRFHGMGAIWDLILRTGLRAAVELPIDHRRGVELGLGASYALHLNNGIADFFQAATWAGWEPTRYDEFRASATVAPHRYRKNFRGPDGLRFEPAYARELELAARYDREWSAAIATRLEYLLDQSAYDAPFHNRDALAHGARVALAIGKRSRVEVGGGIGISTSPGEVEQGIVVDRSFREGALSARVRLEPSHSAAIDASCEFRIRDFTTSVSQDLTYFDRTDRRVRAEFTVSKKLGSGFSLSPFAEFTRNYSDRSDPNLGADEAGFVELVAGARLAWRLSTGGDR
jgi:hypothetical protein